MATNPAIHRRPSGDVDIALPVDEPEGFVEASEEPVPVGEPEPESEPRRWDSQR